MDKEELKLAINRAIDNIAEKVDYMQSKSSELKADAKQDFDQQLGELKVKKEELQFRLNKLESESSEKWQEAKIDLETALDFFRSGMNKLNEIIDR